MSAWNHSLCLECYNIEEPDRLPVRLVSGEAKICCRCKRETTDGIFYRMEENENITQTKIALAKVVATSDLRRAIDALLKLGFSENEILNNVIFQLDPNNKISLLGPQHDDPSSSSPSDEKSGPEHNA